MTPAAELCAAVGSGNKRMVRQILKRNPGAANGHDEFGQTPLSLALMLKLEDIAFLLMKNGADVSLECIAPSSGPNCGVGGGVTPIYIAAQMGLSRSIKALVAANADVNAAETCIGSTPLLMACENMHTGSVALLIEAKAALFQPTKTDGTTALCIAIQRNHGGAIRLLVEAKLDLNADVCPAPVNPNTPPVLIGGDSSNRLRYCVAKRI